MGTGFVRGLLARGHDVTVWNRSADKARPLAAALPALAEGVPVVDFTTTAPLPTRARGARLAAAGRPFLHAPVFMTPDHALKAQGLMLCAGPEDAHATLAPELAAMTGTLTYLGPDLARAAAFKLFGNAMFFAVVGGLADVLTMARAVGIEANDVIPFLSKLNPARQIDVRGAKMARGDYTASFELAMARKDTRLMLETAGDAALVVLPAIAARMDAAIAAGHGRDDLAVMGRAR